MLPIILDAKRARLALVGRGETLVRRVDWLQAGGAARLTVFTDTPTPDLAATLGPALVERLPTSAELAAVQILWLTGLPEDVAGRLADTARRLGVLTNVEDVLEACDFHTPALVRRGDLLLTVSTGGKSPGLAARVRARLEAEYGPEWDERLDRLARKRAAWRRVPRGLDELAALTDAVIDRQGWLSQETCP